MALFLVTHRSIVPVPNTIKIMHEPDYHTDRIGRCEDGRQFMAFVVASLTKDGHHAPNWQKHKRWHAVLHTFDADGTHLNTEVWTGGTSADGERAVIAGAQARLSEMLKTLGPVTYGDVKVSLFRVEVDERVFGLVDASEPAEYYESIHLLPNDLAFFEPWDGSICLPRFRARSRLGTTIRECDERFERLPPAPEPTIVHSG